MATLTNFVMQVNKSLDPSQRFIYLTDQEFDGDEGEGQFLIGYGPDYIPVYDILGRCANHVEIYLRENSGGATSEYAISLVVNAKIKIIPESRNRYTQQLGMPIKHYDQAFEVDNPIAEQEIVARAGGIISWEQTYGPIYNIEINGIGLNGGTLGEFNIKIS